MGRLVATVVFIIEGVNGFYCVPIPCIAVLSVKWLNFAFCCIACVFCMPIVSAQMFSFQIISDVNKKLKLFCRRGLFWEGQVNEQLCDLSCAHAVNYTSF